MTRMKKATLPPLRITEQNEFPPSQSVMTNAPFRPVQLYALCLVTGLIGITYTLVLNWRRLRHPEHIGQTIGLCLIGLLLISLIAFLIVMMPINRDFPSFELAQMAATIIIGVPFSFLMVEQQKSAYSNWVAEHGNRKPILSQQGGWLFILSIIILGLIASSVAENILLSVIRVIL